MLYFIDLKRKREICHSVSNQALETNMRKINIREYIPRKYIFSILLKRIEQQAIEINRQKNIKTCKSCSKLKKEMKELKKNHKLLKFKAGIQTYHDLWTISREDSMIFRFPLATESVVSDINSL